MVPALWDAGRWQHDGGDGLLPPRGREQRLGHPLGAAAHLNPISSGAPCSVASPGRLVLLPGLLTMAFFFNGIHLKRWWKLLEAVPTPTHTPQASCGLRIFPSHQGCITAASDGEKCPPLTLEGLVVPISRWAALD